MSLEAEPNVNPLIWAAIEQKRLLRFRYKNRERIVEPHDYGIHNGLIKLFGYQVGGSSSQKLPNWRWAEQDLISDIQLLDPTFSVGARQNRANITNGTSCSSESNRLITTRNKPPLLPKRPPTHAYRKLTEQNQDECSNEFRG